MRDLWIYIKDLSIMWKEILILLVLLSFAVLVIVRFNTCTKALGEAAQRQVNREIATCIAGCAAVPDEEEREHCYELCGDEDTKLDVK